MAVLAGLGGLDLMLTKCRRCSYLTIHGFHQQVQWQYTDLVATAVLACEKCGLDASRPYSIVGSDAEEALHLEALRAAGHLEDSSC